MENNKTKTIENNLQVTKQHIQYLNFEINFGIAVRGGVITNTQNQKLTKRIVSDINILTPQETREIATLYRLQQN